MLTCSVLCLGMFSAFMLYDVKRVIDGGETNYISATLAIYLDLYNVFQSLLALLGHLRRRERLALTLRSLLRRTGGAGSTQDA